MKFLTLFPLPSGCCLPAEPAAPGSPSPFPRGSRAQPSPHSTRWRCLPVPQAVCVSSWQLPNCLSARDSSHLFSARSRNVLCHYRVSLLHSGPADTEGMKARSAQAASLWCSWDLSRDFTIANMMFAWEMLVPTAASCLQLCKCSALIVSFLTELFDLKGARKEVHGRQITGSTSN